LPHSAQSIIIERQEPSEEQTQGMCLDKGYDYDGVRDILREFGFTAHIHTRGEETRALKKEAGFKARRWVVERAHSWIGRNRRLSKDYEYLPATSEVWVYLSMLRVMLKRLAHEQAEPAFHYRRVA
jgi:transposase